MTPEKRRRALSAERAIRLEMELPLEQRRAVVDAWAMAERLIEVIDFERARPTLERVRPAEPVVADGTRGMERGR